MAYPSFIEQNSIIYDWSESSFREILKVALTSSSTSNMSGIMIWGFHTNTVVQVTLKASSWCIS